AYKIDFISYHVHHLENRFIDFVRAQLDLPIISWTVRSMDEKAVSDICADQITFEGFDPRTV
ncbi:MAG: glycerophosphodiester phosphodiesterase, partial [Alphaproteobacteria bacterium]